MKKIDKVIIKILLEICEILTYFSDKICFTSIMSIKKIIVDMDKDNN